jgi:hypothetical protein
MAIYGQPNSWTCGPFALKHALLAFGVFAREDDLSRLAGSTEQRGTDELGLRRAAGAYRARLVRVRKTEAGVARGELETWLKRHVPVLLCVDQWEHWMTAVAADREHLVVFDSKYDAPLRAEPWESVLPRMACHRPYLRGLWTRTIYDLHPILPRTRAGFRLSLDAARARLLLAEDNATLAHRWDDYARALLPLSLAPGDQFEMGFDLARFIEQRRGTILELAPPEAAPVVDGLAFVAGMYGAILRPEVEPDAVRRLAVIATELALPPAAIAAA